jgi:putative phosphoesterase
MRIAVLADTHDRLPPGFVPGLAGADEIWHLGDICSPPVLAELRTLGVPVHAVRGNCDPRGMAPETLVLERGGASFFLVHEPPFTVPAGTGFALHGHTHVPRDETADGIRFLNPGSVGKANHGAPPSFAWLEIPATGPVGWTVVALR